MPSSRRKSFLRRLVSKVTNALGFTARSSRRVRFQPDAAVYEFERQILGGGGVPDGDGVSLGLGNRCVNTFLSPLSDSEGKDEYASVGYLDIDHRTKLLQEWSTKHTIKQQIERTKCELEQLQRERDETASSPRDQRYMPSNMGEAMLLASQDEEEAVAARVLLSNGKSSPRFRTTPKRRCTERDFGSPTLVALASPIHKTVR